MFQDVYKRQGYLKGKSAMMMFDRHANLKYQYGNRHFWAEGYYVSTVGLNDQTVAKYIREQEAYNIAMDKLSVKEYKDPFEEKEIKKEKKKKGKKEKMWIRDSYNSLFKIRPYRYQNVSIGFIALCLR